MQCPWCGGAFSVTPYEGSLDTDVHEGLLGCSCGRVFPIVRGIPRVLPDAFALHTDFVAKYGDRLPAQLPRPDANAPNADAIRRTRESFGYQWTVFSEMVIDFRENFLQYISPVKESFFPASSVSTSGAASAGTSTTRRSSARRWLASTSATRSSPRA